MNKAKQALKALNARFTNDGPIDRFMYDAPRAAAGWLKANWGHPALLMPTGAIFILGVLAH